MVDFDHFGLVPPFAGSLPTGRVLGEPQATYVEATCLMCGCNDVEGCQEEGCYWILADHERGEGVCSSRACEEALWAAIHAGMTDADRERSRRGREERASYRASLARQEVPGA